MPSFLPLVRLFLLVCLFGFSLKGQYTLSPGYNSYDLINNRGDLAETLLNIGSSQQPDRYNQITIKTADQMRLPGLADRYVNPEGLPAAASGIDGISIAFEDDGRLLVGWRNFNSATQGQYVTGAGIFKEGSYTPLNGGTSFWGADMNADGWVVGWEEKTGLGHKTLESIDVEPWFRSVPWVTMVPVALSPGGGRTEIPHPNGQLYGLQTGESAWDVLIDNEAILTAVNNNGVAVGTGHEKATDGGGFVSHTVRQISFFLSLPGGEPTLIPTPWDGDGSMGGACDINDRGEIVGMDEGQTWIYLPSGNYGLGSGTHIIRESDWNSGYGSRTDWRGKFIEKDVKINNRGMVIWSSNYAAPDEYSTKIWDRGTLIDVNTLNPNPDVSITGVIDVNDRNQLLVFTDDYRTRVLSPSALSLELDPDKDVYAVDEVAVLTVRLDHAEATPATYRFTEPMVTQDSNLLEFVDPEIPEPFVLGDGVDSWETELPVAMLRPGVTQLSASVEITPEGGEPRIETVSIDVIVNPLQIEITITPREYLLNQVPEEQFGDRARQVNEQLRAAGQTPYANLIEIELKVTNGSKDPVNNLTVPDAADLFALISSTDPEKPGVPINRILFFKPDETIHDYTNPQSNPSVQAVSLAEDETATFAWIVEPYDANPEPLIDNSADLEFQPLVLAGFQGKTVSASVEEPFVIVDQPLLKWGIKPVGGRTAYKSGQPVRVEGFLENVSTEHLDEGRNLVVVVYPIQEGNLGGGFLKDVKSENPGFPDYYDAFEVPFEGDGKRIDLSGLFVTMPALEPMDAKVAYGVKLWIVEENGDLTSSDSQAVVAEDWSESFAVSLAGNRPQLSDAEQRRAECEQLGIWPFLCGVEEGSLEFAQGVHGLYNILLTTAEGHNNLWRGIFAYEMLAAKSLWDAIQGDPDAFDELWRDSYAKYKRFVELGIIAGEGISKTPMLFDAFSQQMGDAMSNFFGAVENGDMKEVQFQIGRFLGANPDILLEPLAVGAAYTRMARTLQKEVVGDALATARKLDIEKRQASLADRIAAAKADPSVQDVATVLRPGDKLTPDQLFDIYGVDAEQLELVQRIARRNGVIITFRSRNPISVDLIRSGIAWPKPQFLKFKNVNRIDVDYLGYPENAFGMVDILEPPPSLINKTGDQLDTAIDQYLDVLKGKKPELKTNDVLVEEVRSRLKLRTEEWNKYVPDLKLKNGDSAVIGDTSFGEDLQFTPGKVQDRVKKMGSTETRRFETYPEEAIIDAVSERPRRRWMLAMSGPDGKDLRRVTGDVDFMALLEPNGGMIRDPDKRVKIYKQLAEALDMQHGESFTFFMQDARLKYLLDHVPGGEAMISILPHGPQTPTATFFNDALSIMDGSKNAAFLPTRQVVQKASQWTLKEGKVVLKEGKKITMRRPDPTGEFIALMGLDAHSRIDLDFVNRFTTEILSKTLETWYNRFHFQWPRLILKEIGQEASDAEFAEKLTNGPRSGLYRQLEDNASPGVPLLQLDFEGEDGEPRVKVWEEGSGWRIVSDAEAVALGRPGVLDMLPISSITSMAEPGQRELQIVSMAEMEMTGDFFDRGDRVVINPGADNEEFGTVVAVNPLVLAEGLIYEHLSAEPIASLGPDTTDRDADGLTGLQEVDSGTSPEIFDTDGDGIGDGAELANGTDPLDPASGMRMATQSRPGISGGLRLSWQASAGQAYTLQMSDGLTPLSWQSLGPVIADSPNVVLDLDDAIAVSGNRFYRVVVEPREDADRDGLTRRAEQGYGTDADRADSDGDGMLDGEEVALGTDPTDPLSRLEIQSVEMNPGGEAVEIRFNSRIGLTYIIEVAGSPFGNGWREISRVVADTGVMAVSIPQADLETWETFFRVRADY
jgi:hypothetical protein